MHTYRAIIYRKQQNKKVDRLNALHIQVASCNAAQGIYYGQHGSLAAPEKLNMSDDCYECISLAYILSKCCGANSNQIPFSLLFQRTLTLFLRT